MLVEKVVFDKQGDCRESYKMPFSLPRRRTKVLREGKKRANICEKVRHSMCLTFLVHTVFYCFILRLRFFLSAYMLLGLYRQSDRIRNAGPVFLLRSIKNKMKGLCRSDYGFCELWFIHSYNGNVIFCLLHYYISHKKRRLPKQPLFHVCSIKQSCCRL